MNSTVMQQHQSSFSGLGARVRLRTTRIVEGFDLLPYVEYWRNSTRIEPFGITSTRKDATLGADVRYSFQREGWRPYLGAGFGLHFLSTEVDAPTLGLAHANDSVIKGGLSALAWDHVPADEAPRRLHGAQVPPPPRLQPAQDQHGDLLAAVAR